MLVIEDSAEACHPNGSARVSRSTSNAGSAGSQPKIIQWERASRIKGEPNLHRCDIGALRLEVAIACGRPPPLTIQIDPVSHTGSEPAAQFGLPIADFRMPMQQTWGVRIGPAFDGMGHDQSDEAADRVQLAKSHVFDFLYDMRQVQFIRQIPPPRQ